MRPGQRGFMVDGLTWTVERDGVQVEARIASFSARVVIAFPVWDGLVEFVRREQAIAGAIVGRVATWEGLCAVATPRGGCTRPAGHFGEHIGEDEPDAPDGPKRLAARLRDGK